jgi:uncharacterized protein
MENFLPPRIHVLTKPTGAICNLDCSYCFFLDKEELYPNSNFRMSDEVLETYIRQLIESHKTPEVTVAWQGGEPTLMGLDFFKKAIAYQEKYRRPGMTFENTLQTNGTLLNDEWCEFFKANNYLIGLSLDGPRELHDANRVDKVGRPTFDRVMKGLRLLQKHGVEYNILTTVNWVNSQYPLEVYRFLRDEVKTSWIQFIPVVERINEDGKTLYQKGTQVSENSEWVRRDVGKIFVQTFEAAVRSWLGLPTGMCFFSSTCGSGVALEHNGDLYSCDHFVEPDYLLGNIQETSMAELVGSSRQFQFGQDKLTTLPRYCQQCEVRFACHGECPKHRFTDTPDGEPGLNYLCAGYKTFFTHIDNPLKMMVNLLRQGKDATEIMPKLAAKDRAKNKPVGFGKLAR